MGLLEMSLAASALIVAVVLLRALALHHLPQRVFGVLWGLVVLRLLVPLALPSPASVFNWLRPAAGPAGLQLPATAVEMPAPAAASSAADVPAVAGGPSLLVLVWLAGVVVCAACVLVGYVKSLRRFRQSLPAENPAAGAWLAAHPLRRRVAVRVSDRIRTPLTYGLLRPVILLPGGMDKLDGERLGMVLTHEWVHIRRWDAAKKLVLAACCCLHWFNPLVWLMAALAGRDIELACDAEVLRRMGEGRKKSYAHTLIDLSARAPGFALTNSFGKNAIEERVGSIMKHKKNTAGRVLLSVLVVAGMALVFGTSAMAGASDTADAVAVEEVHAVAAAPAEAQNDSCEEDTASAEFGGVPDALGKTMKQLRIMLEEMGYCVASVVEEVGGETLRILRLEGDSLLKPGWSTGVVCSYQEALEQWEAFGITIDPVYDCPLYEGKPIKFFADNRTADGGFNGTIYDMEGDVEGNYVTRRDANGTLIAIDEISDAEAAELATWR